MTVKQTVGFLVACAALVPAGAGAQLNIFLPAACDLKPNGLVTGGMQSLRTAFTTKFADQKTKELKDAERVLLQAVASAKPDKPDKPDKSAAAAWYYLGRYYLLTDDLPGADSAFNKAQALEPKCGDDIDRYRRQAWVPVFNAGVQAWQAGNIDSAITAFQRANHVYRAEPMGFIYLANLFVGKEQTDSAAKYFKLAAAAATDPKYARDRRDALFNVARVYHAGKRYDDAAAAYRQYLEAYPNDVQARASLASLYQLAGKRDSAMTLYGQIVDHADSASADELFGAAQAVLAAIPSPPDTLAMNDACKAAAKKKTPAATARQLAARCHPAAADTTSKYRVVADPQYQLTVKMYAAGLAKNPYLRDALYNLAGISYLMGDTSKVLSLALRLYAVDPLNRMTLAKVAGGYQLIGKKDSVLYYLTLADSLPVDVTISRFAATEKGAELQGLLTNTRSKPSPALNLTFEFLDPKGTVVATQVQAVPALKAGANEPFKLKADVPGITAWRYHR
jgi:tetratricopeptide (TPR) repeat protein